MVMEFCFVFHLLNGEIPFNLKKQQKKRFYPNSNFFFGCWSVFAVARYSSFVFIFEMITTCNTTKRGIFEFAYFRIAKCFWKRGGVVNVQTKFLKNIIFKSFKYFFKINTENPWNNDNNKANKREPCSNAVAGNKIPI